MMSKLFFRFFKGRDFKGTLQIKYKGKVHSFGKGETVKMQIIKPGFFRRVMFFGDIGFAQGYFLGYFKTPDLRKLLLWFLENRDKMPSFQSSSTKFYKFEWARLFPKTLHLLRKNTRPGSKRNIRKHYDLSNRFYSLWLDRTMTYSSAVFDKGMGLAEAQENKYRKICEKLKLKKTDHLLEIGTGWGGFAEYVAKKHGCKITTVTISKKQYAYAKKRLAGLDVDLRFEDYRDIKGKYDKIASIEMMEALGHYNVPLFVKRCKSLLNEGGRLCYQCIIYPHDDFSRYLKSQNFIKQYIFPGGELIWLPQLEKEMKNIGFAVKDIEHIGLHYADTLYAWRDNFVKKKKEIIEMFSEQFYRKWYYYFVYCGVGFETGYLDDVQLLAA